eukprot:gene15085-20298_t
MDTLIKASQNSKQSQVCQEISLNSNVYGNFHKYYTFHSADSRSSLLSIDHFYRMWLSQKQPNVFTVLDVGCNEGDLTLDLFTIIRNALPSWVRCVIIGIDIDKMLIELAVSKSKNFQLKVGNDDTILFLTTDLMDESFEKEVFNKLKCDLNFSSFSFISLFSVTMWIHLNWGDDGLRKCFSDCISLYLSDTGSILVEPQPWKCYRSAAKRCRKSGVEVPINIETIQLRQIDRDIIDIMEVYHNSRRTWSIGKEIWGRSIFIFHMNNDDVLDLNSLQAILPDRQGLNIGETVSNDSVQEKLQLADSTQLTDNRDDHDVLPKNIKRLKS